MLKITKLCKPCAERLLPLRWAHKNMPDPKSRKHLKRAPEEGPKVAPPKSKKSFLENTDSVEVKLRVVGNGAHGSPCAVVLNAAKQAYIFNCGEGTQRLCTEYKVRLTTITNMFFTSSTWENLGGVPEYIITAQGMGLSSVTIHKIKNLDRLLDSTRNFVNVKDVEIVPYDSDYFEDETLRVKQVKLESSGSAVGNEVEVFAYICRAYDKHGRFSLEKCVEKGVPPGPLLAKLKSGEEITLKNGSLVRPADVMTSTQPGPVVIILECPSEEYVDSLLASKEIAEHQNLPDTDARYHAGCVVHMTPGKVYKSEKYRKFLKLFPERTHHLHLHEDNSTAVSMAAHTATGRLNLIDDKIFPLLPPPKNEKLPSATTLYLRRDEFEENPDYHASMEELVQEVRALEDFDSSRADLLKRVASIPRIDDRDYPKLTFLGTGASQPTKYRNASGILVRPTEDTAFLLDCGNSISNQMIRGFGAEKADELIAQLKFIYISHIHADHHLGLAGLLLRRQELGIAEELTVIAPGFLPRWLRDFSEAFKDISCDFRNSRGFMNDAIAPETYSSQLAVKRITTCFVKHCHEASAIRVDLDNYSLVYSGDTMPCENLVKLGINCDLLIHEATMEDDLVGHAARNRHSTTGQARETGKKMNAKFTILTHFSQRYQKLPLIDERYFADGRLGLAFDYMHVSPRNLHVLPLMYPMLKCVYAEDYDFAQERSQKLATKKALLYGERVSSGVLR